MSPVEEKTDTKAVHLRHLQILKPKQLSSLSLSEIHMLLFTPPLPISLSLFSVILNVILTLCLTAWSLAMGCLRIETLLLEFTHLLLNLQYFSKFTFTVVPDTLLSPFIPFKFSVSILLLLFWG